MGSLWRWDEGKPVLSLVFGLKPEEQPPNWLVKIPLGVLFAITFFQKGLNPSYRSYLPGRTCNETYRPHDDGGSSPPWSVCKCNLCLICCELQCCADLFRLLAGRPGQATVRPDEAGPLEGADFTTFPEFGLQKLCC